MSRDAVQQALDALEDAWLDGSMGKGAVARHNSAITALREELAKPELMRMPKIDDRVIFIEGGIEGTVRLISPTGGPFIKFVDGTDGQWSLYEFGEMFYYQGKE